MTRILNALAEVTGEYDALFCDLWGCLHNGRAVYPAAVAALQAFRQGGGTVVLLTNAPRPAREVAIQLEHLGAPRDCYDVIVSSGDAAQAAMASGMFGRRVYHLGPERDLTFFKDDAGKAIDVTLVPLDEAEGIICTGLLDDRTETPEDYRLTIAKGVNRGLKLLCANPDIVVDVGETRIYCAGAIAQAYTEAGGESLYFGKPHSPIYALARQKLTDATGRLIEDNRILAIGDGIATDAAGALGEGLDCTFVTGGLAAEDTGTGVDPDPTLLAEYLAAHKTSVPYAMGFLR